MSELRLIQPPCILNSLCLKSYKILLSNFSEYQNLSTISTETLTYHIVNDGCCDRYSTSLIKLSSTRKAAWLLFRLYCNWANQANELRWSVIMIPQMCTDPVTEKTLFSHEAASLSLRNPTSSKSPLVNRKKKSQHFTALQNTTYNSKQMLFHQYIFAYSSFNSVSN